MIVAAALCKNGLIFSMPPPARHDSIIRYERKADLLERYNLRPRKWHDTSSIVAEILLTIHKRGCMSLREIASVFGRKHRRFAEKMVAGLDEDFLTTLEPFDVGLEVLSPTMPLVLTRLGRKAAKALDAVAYLASTIE